MAGRFAIGLIAGLAVTAASAQNPPVSALLSQLDTASSRFKSMQADVRYDQLVKLAGHTLSAGSMYIERSGKSEDMAASVTEEGASHPLVYSYAGGTLQVYTPGENQVDVFKAGANQAKYESFLTLGSGGSGKELAQTWNIRDSGAETIEGVKTEKLELTAKDPSVASLFKQVIIWVDPVRGVCLKQFFLQPNGDSKTAFYSNIRVNSGKIDKKPYAIDKGAKKIIH